MPRRRLPVLLTALAVGALAAIAVAPPALAAAPKHGTQDFSFDSYSADYYLGLDSSGRSTLKTVETLVAEFPASNQNHGILRAIPKNYDGHPTDLRVLSVTDENGRPRPWRDANNDESVSSEEDNFRQIVSRAADYVHGRQTYVITYVQHNVTEHFSDTNDDEFYWDTNGTGWGQPFAALTARVHVSPTLVAALNGQVACYRGAEGSTTKCELSRSAGANGEAIFTAKATGLSAGENVTVAIGFTPGTIVGRDSSYLASPFAIPQLASLLGAIVAFILVIRLRLTRLRDAPGRPFIIAEYAGPKGVGLLTDAVILKEVNRGAAATIVDLAVRGKLRIIEGKGIFGRPNYTLELVSMDGLNDHEHRLASIFFPSEQPGAQYLISRDDTTKSRAVYALVQSVSRGLRTAGYQKPRSSVGRTFILATVLNALAVAFGVFVANDARGHGLGILLAVPPVVFMIIEYAFLFRKPLSAKGAELRDHLRGLRLYIELAEADRLRVLQSPQGAIKTPVSTSDPRQLVKLYERVLPYAVLFNLEKDWAKEIGKYYDDTSPDWYVGSSAFNAGLFAASLGSFSSATASSFSGSAGSSSSGGSGGGGSSGGGGGGGGGGGV